MIHTRRPNQTPAGKFYKHVKFNSSISFINFRIFVHTPSPVPSLLSFFIEPPSLPSEQTIAMRPIFSLLLLLSLAPLSLSAAALKVVSDEENQCVYTVYVRTGSIWKGGTDSVISVALAGPDGWGVQITDLVSWGGLMGPDHDYFERGDLDIFSGRGPCLPQPPCWMNLTSDGSGPHHGWYCNYVEVTTTGPHAGCAQQTFEVEQWLATDASPYQLYAVRDICPEPEAAGGGGRGAIGPREARALRAGA